MIYDERIILHMIELRKAKQQKIGFFLKMSLFLIKLKSFKIFINSFEFILGFLLSLKIPVYSDFILFIITYLPGSPYYLGNYLRGVYWSKRLRKMGKNTLIEQGVIIRNPQDVELDEFVLIDKNVLLEAGKIKIGKRVHIAENCVISGGGEFIMMDYSCMAHSSAAVTATDTPNYGFRGSGPMIPWEQRKVVIGKIIVEKDVFIGMGARILPNVVLKEGCVVASGALINKDVEPWKIVAGIPAKVIGEREKVKFEY